MPRFTNAIDFNVESMRLDQHLLAYAVIDSHAFASTELVEQNETDAPETAGDEDVLWFRVWSLTPGKLGPWAGRWAFKRAGSTAITYVDVDPGTAPGLARVAAFVKSVRDAALHPDVMHTTSSERPDKMARHGAIMTASF